MTARHTLFTLLGVLIIIGSLATWLSYDRNPPTDKFAQERFYRTKPLLEKLKQMLVEDKRVSVVSSSGITPSGSAIFKSPQEAGVMPSRYQDYIDTLDQAEVKAAGLENDEFKFPVSAYGFGSKGWRFAFIYRSTPPDPTKTLTTLDDFHPSGNEPRQGYRHLEGGWYAWIVW